MILPLVRSGVHGLYWMEPCLLPDLLLLRMRVVPWREEELSSQPWAWGEFLRIVSDEVRLVPCEDWR